MMLVWNPGDCGGHHANRKLKRQIQNSANPGLIWDVESLACPGIAPTASIFVSQNEGTNSCSRSCGIRWNSIAERLHSRDRSPEPVPNSPALSSAIPSGRPRNTSFRPAFSLLIGRERRANECSTCRFRCSSTVFCIRGQSLCRTAKLVVVYSDVPVDLQKARKQRIISEIPPPDRISSTVHRQIHCFRTSANRGNPSCSM